MAVFRLPAILVLSIVSLGTAVAQSAPETKPVMTEELMARLIKRTLESKLGFAIAAQTCAVFGLADAGRELPAKQVSESVSEGKHLFMVPQKEGSKDVLLGFRDFTTNTVELYLTDRTGVLRAAAIATESGIHLITNEQAAKKFKAEMQLFARLAAELPPSESVSADKHAPK